jgi:type IV secretory pathway TrbD component
VVVPMTSPSSVHTVYRSVNRPLTIWGAERRLFFLALVMGTATFNLFGSLVGGVAMFVALYLCARWATGKDPQMLRIVLNSGKFKAYYDPAKQAVPAAERTERR